MSRTSDPRYPPISDYAFLSDGRCAALVSRRGSVDWCCVPRFDSPSCFGRLLDHDKGGHCSITAVDEGVEVERRYLDGTLILETTFRKGDAEVRLLDGFLLPGVGDRRCGRLFRILDGIRGEITFDIDIVPRFEYGELLPWIQEEAGDVIGIVGGTVGLAVHGDWPLERTRHELHGQWKIRAGDHCRMLVRYTPPQDLHPRRFDPRELDLLDREIEETIEAWHAWSLKVPEGVPREVRRSANVLQGLVYRPSGAFVGAPTTSLPGALDGPRNWDYRCTWIRDSVFALDSLGRLGCRSEAMAFRHFVERSAAGDAGQMHPLYGIEGEFRRVEFILPHLEGYLGIGPVRVGNLAYLQQQHDMYGELLNLAYRSREEEGSTFEPEYLHFLESVVDEACKRWREPDNGIWEVRQEPRHFVHSKVMCWVAVERACKLLRGASEERISRWTRTRSAIRQAIETRGYDDRRGVFVREFDGTELDAALLLLPRVGFVDWKDPRMIRTVDAIRQDLCRNGQVLRYRVPDGLPGEESTFIPCTFWLVEALARQGRTQDARELYDQTIRCGNDLGLFAEQYDPETGHMIGNFPLGLSHHAHITAALALFGSQDESSVEAAPVQ